MSSFVTSKLIKSIGLGAVLAATVPDAIRSRVTGAWGFVNNGIRPLGALIGSVLPTLLGLQGALWVGAVGACFGFLWLIPSRIITFRNANDFVPPEETDASSVDV